MNLDQHIFADALAATVADDEYFGAEGPCPILHEPGSGRLVLITGGNASGKSFLAKVLHANLVAIRNEKKRRIEWIPVSMSMRTQSGIHRVFMFDDEDRDSTGRISIGAVLSALQTCRGREGSHILLLDEPDVGLSAGYQAALGELLADFITKMPDLTLGLIIITHSRAIAERLLPLGPTCFRVGDDLRPTSEWVRDGDLPKSVADLENLAKVANKRMRAIMRAIEARIAGSHPKGP